MQKWKLSLLIHLERTGLGIEPYHFRRKQLFKLLLFDQFTSIAKWRLVPVHNQYVSTQPTGEIALLGRKLASLLLVRGQLLQHCSELDFLEQVQMSCRL